MWSVTADGRFLIRIAPGSGSGGGVAQALAPQITPAGQTLAGAAGRAPTTSGLTALLNWTSALPKTK
jgi:hypothetical protein